MDGAHAALHTQEANHESFGVESLKPGWARSAHDVTEGLKLNNFLWSEGENRRANQYCQGGTNEQAD